MIDPAVLRGLHAQARRLSRRAADAEDLLQDALVIALSAGRLGEPGAAPWVVGVMRNLARMSARTEMRRRRREAAFAEVSHVRGEVEVSGLSTDLLDRLPRSLRIVAILAAAGATRAEIGHLLDLPDTALRQRLSALRKRWASLAEPLRGACSDLADRLALGAIRRALLPLARRTRPLFASHDPDGHLFAFGNFEPRPHKLAPRGNQPRQP